MKIKYINEFNRLVISGEDCLIIPNKNEKACLTIDSESIDRMVEKHGVRISFERFLVNGNKLNFKEKIKIIFQIIKL